MSLLGSVLLLTAALLCTAAPAPDGSCKSPPRLDEAALQGDWDDDSYPQETQATYQCRPGYSRLGSIKMKCKDGSWIYVSRGQCKKRSCGHPGDIPFGSFQLIDGDSFVFGAVVQYSCDDGYRMVSRERKRQCTATGWSNYPPHCEVKNCPPIEAAENINVLSTSYDDEYSVGQVVRFECKDPNLKLDGPSEIFCTSDGDWNLNPPSCIEIRCKTPLIDNGAVSNPKKDPYNNKELIQFTCKEGFTPSTSREVTCTKDGWSPTPACNEIVCSLYTEVEKGKLIGTKAQYRYGEEIDVECEDGYVLQEEPNKRRKCTSNGWYPPSHCVSKKCDRPNIQNGGIYYGHNYGYPTYIGRNVDYGCQRGFLPPNKGTYQRISCTKTGWNPEPKCLRQCALKRAFENADIINQQSIYLEGETVKFRCRYNYQTPEEKRDGERTCLPNGEFIPAECSRRCRVSEIPNGVLKSSKTQFEIGDSLEYTCNEGYMTESRKRNDRIECVDGRWSGPPSCKLITCEYDDVQYAEGFVMQYTCPRGQQPKSNSGQCYFYGWGPPPVCEDAPFLCSIPDTSDLILSPHRSSYQINSKVSFSCNEGFVRVGPLESVCTAEGWNPSLPTCKNITSFQCVIKDERNIVRNPYKLNYRGNDEVSVTCERGFTLKGPSKTTCTENGWNPPLPICENESAAPDSAAHPPESKNKTDESTAPDSAAHPPDSKDKTDESTAPDSAAHRPESKDKTDESAAPDSAAHHPDSKDKTDKIPASSVVPPLDQEEKKEQRKQCPPAFSPKHLEIIDPKEEYYSNDTVTMRCAIGYRIIGSPTVRCVEGRWEQPPQCIQLIPCRNPPTLRNGVIIESFKKQKYETDDIVKYQCNPGYDISGSDEITCENGQWSALPTCTEKSCDAAPKVSQGTLLEKKEVYNHGEKAKFKCDKGFQISGDGSATCLNGIWFAVPSCVATSCDPPPRVSNARLNGEIKPSYASGEKVTYSCFPGYELERTFPGEVECKNTQWTDLPVCRQIGALCGPPPVLQFGDTTTFRRPSYKSGDFVEYKCPAYYVLKGNKIVRCLNGVWDEAPVCQEPCTAKEKDMNENNIKLRWRNDEKLYSEHGDYITFACISGYEALPGTQMRIPCKEGKLEYPKCFKTGYCVLDQQTMITNNIHYNVSTVLEHGQTITFQCSEEMTPEGKLEAKCERSKINYPKCTAAKSCKTPEIQNGFLRSEPQASYESGSHVDFQCNENYVINGPINVKCENGEWTDLPVCLSPCKVSTKDLTKHNIQLLPSADPKSILEGNHKHGTEFSVACKSGFRRPNPGAMVIECNEGKFTYPRCFSGDTCRIDQENLDDNNLELAAAHGNEAYYAEGETIRFKCKSGFRSTVTPSGKCTAGILTYPRCTARKG